MVEAISRSDLEQSRHAKTAEHALCAPGCKLLQGDLEGASRWVDTFTRSATGLNLLCGWKNRR